jgi:hypothetical protein
MEKTPCNRARPYKILNKWERREGYYMKKRRENMVSFYPLNFYILLNLFFPIYRGEKGGLVGKDIHIFDS